VRQPLPEMGAAAVRMLLDILQGAEPQPVQMATTLVVRESTAPPRS
jgi:DNA-binding LacI/PurR family transcriptional regulator